MKRILSVMLVVFMLIGLLGCASAGLNGSTSPEATQTGE